MPPPKILNTREIKIIKEFLAEQFGYHDTLDYVFTQSSKNKIFITSTHLHLIDFRRLKINKWGLYLGELKNGIFRLSMEGAQLIGKKAKKNVVELTREEVITYFRGEDVEKVLPVKRNPYVILRYQTDIIGCAKYKEGKIHNHLPKIHRTQELIIK
jgi:NOL1/NOP2/fmu family ribosome biogenesis protein